MGKAEVGRKKKRKVPTVRGARTALRAMEREAEREWSSEATVGEEEEEEEEGRLETRDLYAADSWARRRVERRDW